MSRIGFIGLGVMGMPMARNLIAAGYDLVAYSRRGIGDLDDVARARAREGAAEEAREGAAGEARERADARADARAGVDRNGRAGTATVARGSVAAAADAREVGSACDVVITMLPDSPQVEEVVEELLETARPGSLIVDMSTISPVVTRELAQQAAAKGVGYVDAPVSGGDVGAREATLSIMAGGTAEDYARAKPLFEALGRTITHVGPVGAGQVVKACNQVVVALTIEAVSEALVLGSAAGVDPRTVIDVLQGGLAANRVMDVRARNFLEHDFTPGFRVELHHKDLGIALQAARAAGVALPNTAAVNEMLQALRSRGLGDRDHSALLTHIETLANHTIQAAPAPA
jgi:2-hydroxy-3-oxopropionate reductase